MEMQQPKAISQDAVEDGRQVRESVAEDQDGAGFRGAHDAPHQLADREIPQRLVLPLGIEATEKMPQPGGVE
jgi:hypothetical protein